jgi:outer membrane lipoprotein-sorting protein
MWKQATRFLIAFFISISSSPHNTRAQEQLSVGDLLKRVEATYRQASSFKMVAEKSVELATVGESNVGGNTVRSNFHQSENIQVELSASSSAKAKLQLKDEKKEIVVTSNGKVVWTFIPAQQAYTETTAETTKEQSQSGSKEISGVDLLRDYEILLAARYQSLSPYASVAKLEHSEKLKVGGDKKDCYVLMIQTPQGSHELWIDKLQFVIWKSVDTSPTPSEGISLQRTVTVTAKEIALNSSLESSIFVFTPPAQAMRVDSLKLPGKNPF